jgi:hypothetical protein
LGFREVPVDEKDDGKSVTKKTCGVVRHNAFVLVNDGEALTRFTGRHPATATQGGVT